MPSLLHVVRSGTGPLALLVHGSAADHSTWAIQLASSLRERLSLCAYDRRGTGRSPDELVFTIGRHAEDAAELLAEAGGAPGLIVGSSFGAVIALEVMRRYPERVSGALLIEPPMAASDQAPVAPAAFLEELDALAARAGGEAAAEAFLRAVLGEAAFARMPTSYRLRCRQLWPQIRADSIALAAYQPRYAELAAVQVPTVLLGGERSAAYFRPTLEALAAALPRARFEEVKGAGHMLHAEAFRSFSTHLLALAAQVGAV